MVVVPLSLPKMTREIIDVSSHAHARTLLALVGGRTGVC